MSHSTLIEDLHAKGRLKIEKIWDEARGEVAGLQEAADQQVADEEKRCGLEARQAKTVTRRKMSVAAQRDASAIITKAEQQLVQRLYDLAQGLLVDLDNDSGPELFVRLAGEIPAGKWRHITVNPKDLEVARRKFPDADIIEEAGIMGGLIATSEDGAVTVVNTLEKRLERIWPQLAPQILQDIVTHEKAG